MKVEVSLGEAIDKLSILHLKMKKIMDETKKREIQKEIDCLECSTYIKQYNYFYNLLMFINEKIWDLTDIVKTNPPNYADISKDIFDYNQKRFRIKNWFNLLTNSNIKEQKGYALTNCYIQVDETICFSKLSQISYLALEYDIITINHPNIVNILNIPTIQINENTNELEKIDNLDFDVPDIFTFIVPHTNYVIGGMLGDFIQSLSVICEQYYKTGSKGILYISEKGDKFRNGLLNTYNDLYPVIMKQTYIQDFQIYKNQHIDIDLVKWRNSPILLSDNWYNIYNSTYNIEWGKRKWFESNYNSIWSDKIIINITNYRPLNSVSIDFMNTLDKDSQYVFISSDKSHFDFFINCINDHVIVYYEFKSFDELVTIINSCKLFIGGFSAPLTIAHALHKDRIMCKSKSMIEVKMNDLMDYLPNIKMII